MNNELSIIIQGPSNNVDELRNAWGGYNLIWSTWDKDTSDIIENKGFLKFIPISNNLYDQIDIYNLFKNKIEGV